MKHPIPTPNIARPRQPRPNPTPNMTPEAKKAAEAAKTSGSEPSKKSFAASFKDAVKSITSGSQKVSSPQSAGALADKRDQAKKLKADY
jgi:flagellar hook-basal body complex protein FliE